MLSSQPAKFIQIFSFQDQVSNDHISNGVFWFLFSKNNGINSLWIQMKMSDVS